MRRKGYRILSLALVLATTAPGRAAVERDSAAPKPVDPVEVLAHSLLFPAWGAAGAGAPALAVVEAVPDLLSLWLVGMDMAGTRDPSDPGIGLVVGLTVLTAGRLLWSPVNAAMAHGHNQASAGPPPRRSAFGLTLQHGGFGGLSPVPGGRNLAFGAAIGTPALTLNPFYFGWTGGIRRAGPYRYRDLDGYGVKAFRAWPIGTTWEIRGGGAFSLGTSRATWNDGGIPDQRETGFLRATPFAGAAAYAWRRKLALSLDAGYAFGHEAERDLGVPSKRWEAAAGLAFWPGGMP